MLYRPNYCCSCGEKIERIEWNLLTSRRFCETCALEKRWHDNGGRLMFATGVIFLIFGLGSLWGGISERAADSSVAQPVTFKNGDGASRPPAALVQSLPANRENLPAPRPQDSPPVEVAPKSAAVPGEARSFCGALTKKGTPCSRKVKAKGLRCFQHEGRPEAPSMD